MRDTGRANRAAAKSEAAKPGARPAPADEATLFDRIGRFLNEQGLSPAPPHYEFAFAVVSAPDLPLGKAVARLTENGVRLTRRDIEQLGGRVVDGPPLMQSPPTRAARPARPADIAGDERVDTAIALVAETQHQVDGFAQIMRTMQDETRGFGRDLARSAHAITQLAEIDEITRITSSMIGRIRDSEVRLAEATAEAEALRAKLAEAQESARRDVLTGLPNRRAFDEALASRDAHAGPHCIAVCDIDRFKHVNDVHGHGVGDRVLTAIGQTIAEECAPHLVVRHGGEEFAVLICGIDLEDAAALLDSVRTIVAAKRFRNRETDAALGTITFSAGITAIHADEPTETAFSRADRLLYAAKDQGRDQVCAG
ncbi:GGDEF domain-containing protein [Sphingomonas faeni]|uniref:GGDEF domain-containing protein n=1 Tax=Sphingomonas faeni TaxID=185950 RepID=UPI0020C75AEB|nr:GGDEF domain-containing protein [Sphingomonas faeni]MCP8892100.1 GGDEF domain-containing protein [Sphingomonas faeni]